MREIGAKITLNGTNEYNQSIRSINASMGTLRSETRLLDSQYADSQNSIEALTRKHRVLSDILQQQERKIEQYTQALHTSEENLDRCSNNVNNWRERLQNAQSALDQLRTSQNASNEEIEEQERVVERTARGLQTAENQYRSVEAATRRWETQLNDSQVELNNMQRELDQNARYMREAEESADGCATSIDEFGNAVQQAEEETNTFGEVLRANLVSDVIKSGVESVIGLIKDFSSSVMETAGDTISAMNKIQAATGATESQMEEYGKVLNDVFNDNFGESMEEVGESISTVVQQLGHMDGDSLKQVTEDAYLLKDTFDFDMQESLRAAKMLMDQFGMSSHEAYTLIAQGAQDGLNKNDDLLDTINEYSVLFHNAGLSAEDMFNMLKNGADSGAWSIDKLADAFKEFTIRLQDGTSDDALKQIGLDADEIKEKFNEGGDVAKQAMEQIMSGLSGVTDKSQRYLAMQTMFGTMFEDLGEKGVQALMNISGNADQTADTLEKMNSVRYNDLNSALEGLGRNILTRVSQPFTEASKNMSDGIQSVANRITNGGLGDSLEKLGETMARLISGFVDFASKAAPPVIDALAWMVDHGPIVAGAITAITVAFKYESISKFASFVVGLAGNLGTLIRVATETGTAMGALNAVMTLTPTGILVAGIAGLAAGLGAFAIKAANSANAQDEFNQKCEETAQKVSDLKAEMAKSDDAFKTNTTNIQTQSDKINDLITELYRLDGVQDKDVTTKQRMKVIIQQLNTLNPQFGLSLDNVTGKLNKQKTTVQQLADAFKKQAMAEAYKSELKTKCEQNIHAINNEKEALENLKKVIKEHSTLNAKEVDEYIELYSKTTAVTDAESKRFQELLKGVDLIDKSVKKSDQTYQTAREETKKTSKSINDISNKMAEFSDNTDDASQSLDKNGKAADKNGKAANNLKDQVDKAGVAIKDYGNSADYATTKDEKLIDTQSELQQAISDAEQSIREEYQKTKESAKDSIEGQINYFEIFKTETNKSAKDIIKSFESNRQGVEKWHKDLNTISKSTSKDFVQYLQGLGPGAAGQISTMATMSKSQLRRVEQAWKDTKSEIGRTVDDTYNNVDQKVAQRTKELAGIYRSNLNRESYYSPAYSAGQSVGQGLANGINSKASAVAAAAGNLAERAAAAQRYALGINSPSRVTRKIGNSIGEGNVLGMQDKERDVENAAIKLGNAATKGLSSASSKFTAGNTNYQSIDYRTMSKAFTKALEKGQFAIDRNGTMRYVESVVRRVYT